MTPAWLTLALKTFGQGYRSPSSRCIQHAMEGTLKTFQYSCFKRASTTGPPQFWSPGWAQLAFLFCHLLWVCQLSGLKVTIVKADLGRDRSLQIAPWWAPIKQWWLQLAALGHLMRFWGSIDNRCPLWIPYLQKLQENIGDGMGVAVRTSIIIKMNDNVTVTQGISTQPWFQIWKGDGSRNSASFSAT